MINQNHQIILSKEVNAVILKYAKQVVLREILTEFSFNGSNPKVSKITSLLKSINYYNGDSPLHDDAEQLWDFVKKTIVRLSTDEITALYFWYFDRNYSLLFDRFLDNVVEPYEVPDEQLENRFGEELSIELNNPIKSGLRNNLAHELKDYLVGYSSEFDFSVIDKESVESILWTIDNYCK